MGNRDPQDSLRREGRAWVVAIVIVVIWVLLR